VFRARLDHAYDLFQQRLAPVVITTRGAGADPSYSEGGVGRDYPHAPWHSGTQRDCRNARYRYRAHSAERIGVIMRANKLHSCLAVSDEIPRLPDQSTSQHEGLQVYVAPRSGSRPKGQWARIIAVLREGVSYLVWKLNIPA
jgi:hypothetical protein